jgi:hypothetical protein
VRPQREGVILELPHLVGNLLHDAHSTILMREHGIGRICMRDADFNQFPFLEVIDPLPTEQGLISGPQKPLMLQCAEPFFGERARSAS